jgi:hypothetical protein
MPTGIKGQIIICSMAMINTNAIITRAQNRTPSLTTKPIARLTRLSVAARTCASRPAPGSEIIRFHGAKSVLSNIGSENRCEVRITRFRAFFINSAQPWLYHQPKNSTTSISSIVTFRICLPLDTYLMDRDVSIVVHIKD